MLKYMPYVCMCVCVCVCVCVVYTVRGTVQVMAKPVAQLSFCARLTVQFLCFEYI